MADPRWITAKEVEGGVIPPGGEVDQVLAKESSTDYDLKWADSSGGGGSILTADVPFANDAIIASKTTPLVVIEATETLNYESTPTKLFMPIRVDMFLNNSAGVYNDVDGTLGIYLAWGSDWSYALSTVMEKDVGLTFLQQANLNSFFHNAGTLHHAAFSVIQWDATTNLDGALQDNALVIAIANTSNFSGGNSANTLRVIAQYAEITLT